MELNSEVVHVENKRQKQQIFALFETTLMVLLLITF